MAPARGQRLELPALDFGLSSEGQRDLGVSRVLSHKEDTEPAFSGLSAHRLCARQTRARGAASADSTRCDGDIRAGSARGRWVPTASAVTQIPVSRSRDVP